MKIKSKEREEIKRNESDFKEPYTDLAVEFVNSDEFKKLNDDFVIIAKDYGRAVGYNRLSKVEQKDEVIYAKRKGINRYSKFVKNKDKKETSKVVFILKRDKFKSDEYWLVAMFPGDTPKKEPEDLNIKDKEELIACLNFWKDKAFVWDENVIEQDTITKQCPYKNLSLAIV